ncbi:MAG: branched-chain amino acid ABC transporter permease [Pseudomonadota bacterium]
MSVLPLQSGSKKPGLGWLVHVLVLVVLCSAVVIFPDYYRMLSTEAILLAVFAMSLDLIMGYAGIASFGHAAYFGAGGYSLAMILLHVTQSVWLALFAAAVVSGLLALFVGVISIRARGIYFAIMTLAFGEVLYRIVFHTPALGGSDGLIGIPMPKLNMIFFKVDLHQPLNFCFVAIAFAYASFLVSRRIVNSPFGRVLRGIKDNEDRIPFLGFDPRRYKIIAFTISGILAGLSGALFSLFKSFAVTEQLGFLESGKVIVMTLMGGLGTLIGPMIGAIFITFFETILSAYMESYHIVTGVLFILVVLFFRKGLWGLLLSARKER